MGPVWQPQRHAQYAGQLHQSLAERRHHRSGNTVKAKNPTVKVKFLWNPTDANVQIESAKFYPGDAYVDYIGFDNYDFDYTGIYKTGVQPDAATQQAAWTKER